MRFGLNFSFPQKTVPLPSYHVGEVHGEVSLGGSDTKDRKEQAQPSRRSCIGTSSVTSRVSSTVGAREAQAQEELRRRRGEATGAETCKTFAAEILRKSSLFRRPCVSLVIKSKTPRREAQQEH